MINKGFEGEAEGKRRGGEVSGSSLAYVNASHRWGEMCCSG